MKCANIIESFPNVLPIKTVIYPSISISMCESVCSFRERETETETGGEC